MEKPRDWINIPPEVEISADTPNAAALVVDSDEMYPSLKKDDIVLISLGAKRPKSQDIIVGFCGGKPCYRRWVVRQREIYLVADNPLYADIHVEKADDVELIGTVKVLIKRML